MFKFKKKNEDIIEDNKVDNESNDLLQGDSESVSNDDFNPEDDTLLNNDYESNSNDDSLENKTKITKDDLLFATKKKNEDDKTLDSKEENTKDDLIDEDSNDEKLDDETLDDSLDDEEDFNEETKEEEKPKSKKEIRKENNQDNVYETFKISTFILKLICSTLLFAYALITIIFGIINKVDEALYINLFIIGGIFVLSGIISIFMLIGSNYSNTSKRVSLSISIIELCLGIFVVVCGVIYLNSPQEDFSQKFTKNYFPYFLAAVIYINAVLYLWKTSVHKAKASHFMFWYVVLLLSLACGISGTVKEFDTRTLIIIYGGIAALLGVILLAGALGGYKLNDIKVNGKNEKDKKKSKDKKDEVKEDKKSKKDKKNKEKVNKKSKNENEDED